MEHLLHFFGGGCGEHMLWPTLAASGAGLVTWARSVLGTSKPPEELPGEDCRYCGGDCPGEPDDSEYLCDGFAGDIDGLYEEQLPGETPQ